MDKKYIILGGVIVLLVFIVSLIGFSMLNTSHAYTNFTCNDTGTVFEVPVDLKVRTDNTYGNMRTTMMSTPDGDIVIQRTVTNDNMMQNISSQAYEDVAEMDNSYDGQQINGVTVHTCSRTVKNDTLGETIIVTSNRGDNETVEHIIESIVWGNHSFIDNTSGSVDVSVDEPTFNASDYKLDKSDLKDNELDDDLYEDYFDDDVDSSYDDYPDAESDSDKVDISTG